MPMYRPVHPGELLQEIIDNTDLTVTRLAEHLGVTRANLTRVLKGSLGISPLMAVKLGEAFPKQDAEHWMRLQTAYEFAKLRQDKERKKLKPIVFKEAA